MPRFMIGAVVGAGVLAAVPGDRDRRQRPRRPRTRTRRWSTTPPTRGSAPRCTPGRATVARTVRLMVRGLPANRPFGAHVHAAPCGADPRPRAATTSTAPTVTLAEREVWLDFTTDGDGNGVGTHSRGFAAGTAGSVVIHAARPTRRPAPPEPGWCARRALRRVTGGSLGGWWRGGGCEAGGGGGGWGGGGEGGGGGGGGGGRGGRGPGPGGGRRGGGGPGGGAREGERGGEGVGRRVLTVHGGREGGRGGRWRGEGEGRHSIVLGLTGLVGCRACERRPTVPDTKDWTWVLDRPCPECGFDPAGQGLADLPRLVHDTAMTWSAGARAGPTSASGRRRTSGRRWSTAATSVTCTSSSPNGCGRCSTEDEPTFANWDQDATAVESDYGSQDPTAVAVELIEAAGHRRRHLRHRHRCDARSPRRCGPTATRFTVESLGSYHLHDVVHHLHDVGAS